jgi:hypothetical protein
MNTQTIVLNRKNVIENTNNTRYEYKFPKPVSLTNKEIALASLNMYYSWPNIQSIYNNNIFTYKWWDYYGNLTLVQNVTIPDGNYSISTLSSYIQSQMLLKGHYLKDTRTGNKVFFIELIENPTYYACEITFVAMFSKGSANASTYIYINENPPTTYVNSSGNTVLKGWDYPASQQYPQIVMSDSSNIKDFLGYVVGTYPAANTPVNSAYDMLGTIAPQTYPVSAVNIQSNFCKSEIAIPDNILYSFSQGNSNYGDLIIMQPSNLIWTKIIDGTYTKLELLFIDQDFNQMKILDNQVNFIVLIRDV